MPQSCPRCSRPNGDASTRCLYCGQPLEPVPPDESEPPDAPRWPSTYTVVVTRPLSPALRPTFEVISGHPALWLDAGLPLPIETMNDLSTATALHGILSDAGIPATVVTDERLGERGPLHVARRAAWAGKNLVFLASDERRCEIDPSDLRIAVRATIPEGTDDEGKLRARDMTGKFVVRLAGGAERVDVLDLHAANAPPVRIVAQRFDYSILAGDLDPILAGVNFDRFLELLLSHAPGLTVNAAFAKVVFDDPRMPPAIQLELFGRRLLQAIVQS